MVALDSRELWLKHRVQAKIETVGKKCTTWVLYVRQDEDCSLWDTISRSERVLRGGKRGARIYRDFATKGIVQNIKRLLLIKENQILQFKEFGTFFYIWEAPRVWTPWNHPFDVHLSSLGSGSCIRTFRVSSGLRVGRGCSLRAARTVILFFPHFLMNCSTPGLPVHHQLPEFTQTHIHRVSDAIQPSHPLSSPSHPAPNPSQHQSLFQWVNT